MRVSRATAAVIAEVTPARISQLAESLGMRIEPDGTRTYELARVREFAAIRRARAVRAKAAAL